MSAAPATSLAARLEADGLDWIAPRWVAPDSVQAIFTTRNGPGGRDFDLGVAQPDESAAVVRSNRVTLQRYLPSAPVWLEQVHGVEVITITSVNVDAARAVPPPADAAVTRVPNVVVAIRTADCLPVAFADRSGSVVAAAHAGWRGLAAGVLEATIAAMAVPPPQLVAWIGPAIGPAAFEVGPDVRDLFLAQNPALQAHFIPRSAGKWLADLPALARHRLAAAGVTTVTAAGACSHADARRFFSYRRDRSTGRMALALWIRGPRS